MRYNWVNKTPHLNGYFTEKDKQSSRILLAANLTALIQLVQL